MSKLVDSGQYVITGALDAFTAFHVARKLAVALPTLEVALRSDNAKKDRSTLLLMLFSQLSDEDADFVIRKCLVQVRRAQSHGLAALMAPSGALMFTDIGVGDLMDLAVAVVEVSLGDFFATALGSLQSGAADPT